MPGVKGAFETIVEEYADYVFGLNYRLLGNRQDAEDASQETFIKLFRSYHRLKAEKNLKNLLCTIAINTSRDYLRKRRKYRNTQQFDEESFGGKTYDESDISLTVERMVASLKDTYRMVVVLYYMEGKTVKEIAAMIRRPQVVVKVWLHRARKMLLERYGDSIL